MNPRWLLEGKQENNMEGLGLLALFCFGLLFSLAFKLDLVDYEKIGPSIVPLNSYAIEYKPFISNSKHIYNKTLVIMIGNIRGGEATHWSMYRHLLDVNKADCVLITAIEPVKRSSSLYSRCKAIWELYEHNLWSDALDMLVIGRNTTPIDYWKSFDDKKIFTYIRNKKNRTSAPISMFSRWAVKQMLFRYDLHHKYDRFVITRNDHYYACDDDYRPLNHSDSIYIVSGSDAKGFNDRHWICPRSYIFQCLSLADNIIQNPQDYAEYDYNMNIEYIQTLRLKEMSLYDKVERYPRRIFITKQLHDHNQYSPVGKFPTHFYDSYIEPIFGTFPKYSPEYSFALVGCKGLLPARNHSRLALVFDPSGSEGNGLHFISLSNTFLTPTNSNELHDCAYISFSIRQQESNSTHRNPYLKCRYRWLFPAPLNNDWAAGIDRIIANSTKWRRHWPHIYGDMSDNHNMKKSFHIHPITLIYLRHLASMKIHELGLLDKYEEFIITRSYYTYHRGAVFDFKAVNPRHVWSYRQEASDTVPHYNTSSLININWNFMRCTHITVEYCLTLYNQVLYEPEYYDKKVVDFFHGDKNFRPEQHVTLQFMLMLRVLEDSFEDNVHILSHHNITLKI
jgi:hypothetical protein